MFLGGRSGTQFALVHVFLQQSWRYADWPGRYNRVEHRTYAILSLPGNSAQRLSRLGVTS